jgi:hypothetical protein
MLERAEKTTGAPSGTLHRDGMGAKAIVQVLLKISAQRCGGHTTAAAWRSCVKNDRKSRENNRRALRYTAPRRDGRKAVGQVLLKISAQRCGGHTTAAAWRSRVKNDHKSRENNRRALRYTAPRRDGRKAIGQVLLTISAQRCGGHTTAAAWRSRVKNDHKSRENNRRALRYTEPQRKATNQAPPPGERCRGHKSNKSAADQPRPAADTASAPALPRRAALPLPAWQRWGGGGGQAGPGGGGGGAAARRRTGPRRAVPGAAT